MSSRFVLFMSLCLIVTGGCEFGATRDAACRDAVGEYPAAYLGAANGRGLVSITEAEAGRYKVQLRLVGPEDEKGNTDAFLQISGVGSCKKGILTASLGASDQASAGYKVLGGTLSAIVDRELSSEPFGRWKAQVIEVKSGSTTNLDGFWAVLEERKTASRTTAP